jgi:hypothetical protein
MRYLLVVGKIGGAGAMAGAINGCLCLINFPVPVEGISGFSWIVVPEGAYHGFVLAIVPYLAFLALPHPRLFIRLLLGPLVAWFAGYISWMPFSGLEVFHDWVWAFTWPFNPPKVDSLWLPLFMFGLVSGGVYFFLTSRAARQPIAWRVLAIPCSGILGSLWFWSDIGNWYFALIHGSIWGGLVGWQLQQIPMRDNVAEQVAAADQPSAPHSLGHRSGR